MTISAPTVATRATDRRLIGLGGWLIAALLLQLSACASAPKPRPSLPPPTPAASVAPVRSPSKRPPAKPATAPAAKPAPVDATASSALLDPFAYRRQRQAARAAMSLQPRESLAASEAGYYLDVLQARVKPMVRSGLSMARQANRVDIELSGRAGFAAGSGQLSPVMREMLARLAAMLGEYRKTVVTVRVRGDDAALPAGRARLAELRGLAVTAFLVDSGVARKRILLTSAMAAPNASAGGSLLLQIEPVQRAPARAAGR